MSEEQIKQYYERIEKLLNGSNKETYGFVPEEIRQILKWYEKLQQENQELKEESKKQKEVIDKAIELLNNHTILLPTEYSDEVANFKRNLRNILKEVDND